MREADVDSRQLLNSVEMQGHRRAPGPLEWQAGTAGLASLSEHTHGSRTVCSGYTCLFPFSGLLVLDPRYPFKRICQELQSFSLGLEQQFSTNVVQEFFKYAMPDYLVRGTDLFPLKTVKWKTGNSQHNNSCLVWMNQNDTYCFGKISKDIFLVCHRILLLVYVCHWDEKGWKSMV